MGNETWEGLGVPLYPSDGIVIDAQSTTADVLTIRNEASGTGDLLVLEDSDASEKMYVEYDGTTNWTIAKTAADNAIALTLTSAGTFTTGYHQGFYCSHTATGKFTTGSSQINSYAVDLFLGGEIGCEAEGMYIYVAKTGTLSLTSANISGLAIYIAGLGTSQPSTRCGVQIHMDGRSTPASSQDAFIICRTEATGNVTNALYFQGTTNPTYFIRVNNEAGFVSTQVPNGSVIKTLSVDLNGTEYWIPLYAASTS